MTAKQQKAFNAKAKWVEVSRTVDAGEPMFVDSTDITRIEGVLVLFRVKMSQELAGNAYATVIGHCVKASYMYTNVFMELPSGTLIGEKYESKVLVAERGSVVYHALVYACNSKNTVEIPITSY